MTKYQAKTKQHAEVEFLLLENYVLSLSTLSSRDNKRYSKNFAKTSTSFKCGYMTNVNENEAEVHTT